MGTVNSFSAASGLKSSTFFGNRKNCWLSLHRPVRWRKWWWGSSYSGMAYLVVVPIQPIAKQKEVKDFNEAEQTIQHQRQLRNILYKISTQFKNHLNPKPKPNAPPMDALKTNNKKIIIWMIELDFFPAHRVLPSRSEL